MIKHIVFFRLKEENKKENITKLIEGFHCLSHEFEVEAGENFNDEKRAWDVSLYSSFDSKEELERYNDFPEHKLIKKFVSQVCIETAIVDYEI